jgi:hypothetical protein
VPPTTSLRRSGRVDPLEVHSLVHGTGEEPPDPIEFVLSDRFLDREYLYPRQATILKVIFLREDMLTPYDFDVLGEWGETFRRTNEEGCQPDVLERMRACVAAGRPWFREVVNVTGRRGGKGYLGAVCAAYVLWHFLHRPGGPQRFYGVDRDKRLSILTFAAKKEQAVANQWRDLSNLIIGSPCFTPFVSRSQGQSLTLFAPTDVLRAERLSARGVETESDLASFEILPKESTLTAARGPAAFCLLFDEMAHVLATTGASRSAEDVYESAVPALDQFGMDAFLYEGSSPWQMTGQFYTNWLRSIELEADGSPAYPEMVMFQLPSWGPYQDWSEAERIPLRRPATTVIEVRVELPTGGQDTREVEVEEPADTLPPLRRAIQEYDDQMRRMERANPETFAVERKSHWAAVLDAYLNSERVADIFRPWDGRVLTPTERGRLSTRYKAHGDPASVDCRFGFALGHVETVEREEVDENGEVRVVRQDHVVFDVLDKWEAGDWADRRIHYSVDDTRDENDDGLTVEADIWDYIERFQPDECSFDQWNSIGSVERLSSRARRAKLPKTTTVYVRDSTAQLDWKRWEAFKVAVNMGLIHAPCYDAHGEPLEAAEIAELELRFLTSPKPGRVDHPATGTVTTKDIGDCMQEVVWYLIGDQMTAYLGKDLAGVNVRGTSLTGIHGERQQGYSPTGGADRDPHDAIGTKLSELTSRGRGARSPYGSDRRRAHGGRRGGWGVR